MVYDYLFSSLRESHYAPDMDLLAIPSLILSHMELSRMELRKLTSSILIKLLTISVVLVEQF